MANTVVGPTEEHFIHSIEARCEARDQPGNPPIVCLPGLGGGAAFFFRFLDEVGSKYHVYAVDWLGSGHSGRPEFAPDTSEEAESWFLESLENWREAHSISCMCLLGHNIGGYFATRYALRYPNRVSHLILVSPAGMVGRAERDVGRNNVPRCAARGQKVELK